MQLGDPAASSISSEPSPSVGSSDDGFSSSSLADPSAGPRAEVPPLSPERDAAGQPLPEVGGAGPESPVSPKPVRPRLPRLSCQFTVNCHRSEGSFSAVVNNISLGGLRLEVSDRLKKGDLLDLEFRGPAQGSVPCCVQWCRRLPKKETLLVGVVFNATLTQLRGTWLIEVLEALDTIQAYYQGLSPSVVEPPLARVLAVVPQATDADATGPVETSAPVAETDAPPAAERIAAPDVEADVASATDAVAPSVVEVELELATETGTVPVAEADVAEAVAAPIALEDVGPEVVVKSLELVVVPEVVAEVSVAVFPLPDGGVAESEVDRPEPEVQALEGTPADLQEDSAGGAESELETRDISHLVAPPDSTEAWSRLLIDAQVRIAQPTPLLSRMLRGLRSFAVEDGVSLVERRRIRRMRCHYEVTCNVGGQSFEALAIDVSPAGIGLDTAFTFRKGAVFSVQAPAIPEFAGLAPMVGKVRHTRSLRHRVGLILERTDLLHSWIGMALRSLGFSRAHLEEKRRYGRARTYLAVEARGWRGDFVQGFFLDLGRGGALLQSPQSFVREEQVRLVVGPLGPLPLLYLPGLVVNQRRDPDSQGWLVSVRFLELTKRRMYQLDQYILALLTTNPS